ncbi:DUF5681 domain-containing protein [Dechloromonas agitata]|uniref:DUF5681 domain-containing protein n=1 Tax=Dechloromonas agitata TaxID=73030 RepID=UPI000484D434|nr:DUF5681 domain-containing protein [Dechloromonas agitata]
MQPTEPPSWLSQHKPQSRGWKSGESGNPKGRPKGALNKKTLIQEEFEKEGSKIAKAVIEAAKNGDIQAANIALLRLAPPLKPETRTVQIHLDTNLSLTQQAKQVLEAIACGSIDPENGRLLIDCISRFAGLKQVEELENRIINIENKMSRR